MLLENKGGRIRKSKNRETGYIMPAKTMKLGIKYSFIVTERGHLRQTPAAQCTCACV